MKSKYLILIGLVILFFPTFLVLGGGQPKVDVCHITDYYNFGLGEIPIGNIITIADPAYDSHVAHGDPETFATFTLSDGKVICSFDNDSDGVIDAMDGCPEDSNKIEPGTCGCGNPENDSDGDGVMDCVDNCVSTHNPDQSDEDGDGVGDACDECSLSDPHEPNDVMDTNATILNASPGVSVQGTISPENDVDWYKFTAEDLGTITLSDIRVDIGFQVNPGSSLRLRIFKVDPSTSDLIYVCGPSSESPETPAGANCIGDGLSYDETIEDVLGSDDSTDYFVGVYLPSGDSEVCDPYDLMINISQ